MNSFAGKLIGIGFCVLSSISVVHAQNLPGSTPNSGVNGNPYNSPIKRANPNSRQGTELMTPPGRAPNIAPPVRKPTIENGGIGNGQPSMQAPRPPTTLTPDSRRSN